MIKHDSREAALEHAKGQLRLAEDEQVWMIAVWVVKEDGSIHLHETTCNFPYSGLQESVNMLQRSVDKKTVSDQQPEALPVADLRKSPDSMSFLTPYQVEFFKNAALPDKIAFNQTFPQPKSLKPLGGILEGLPNSEGTELDKTFPATD